MRFHVCFFTAALPVLQGIPENKGIIIYVKDKENVLPPCFCTFDELLDI